MIDSYAYENKMVRYLSIILLICIALAKSWWSFLKGKEAK